jgi:hypothetical protein
VVKNSFLSAILARTQKPKEIPPFTDAQRIADDDSLRPPSLGSKENISGANTPKPPTNRIQEDFPLGLGGVTSNNHISKSSRENSGMFSVGHERKTILSNALFKGVTLLAKRNLGKNFGDTTPGLRKSKQIADMVDEQLNAKAVEVLNTMGPESDEFKLAVRKFYRCNMDKDNGDTSDNIGSQKSLKTRPKEARATVLWKRANSILKKKKAFVAPDERWLIGGGGLNRSSEGKSTPSHSSKNSRPPKSQGQASPLPVGDAKGVPKTGKGFRRMSNMVIQEEHSMSEPDEGMH